MSAGAMTRQSPRGAIPSPYRGLAPFRDSELDAYFFFGRERESEIIGSNLLAARLTVLYGASGVGKSSLLRAGVAQGLRRTALENVAEGEAPEFVVVVLDSWTENPSASLASAMVEAVRNAVGDTEWEPSASAAESLVDVAAACGARLGGDLLLVLDQFEEYFLYHPEAPTIGFGTDLSELVRREDLPVRILIGIREDSLAKLDAFKARIPNLFANFLRLDPLDRKAGRAAILRPIEEYARIVEGEDDLTIEPELAEAVLDGVAAGEIEYAMPGRGTVKHELEPESVEAPYLQLVMERIWEVEREQGSRTLRLATLQQLGGAGRIVEAHLERALAGLSAAERDAAAEMFTHLVTPSGAKVAHEAGDLAAFADVEREEAGVVLDRLADERILRPLSRNGAGARYEIYHDVLGAAVLDWRARHEAERRLERERQVSRTRHRRLAAAAVLALLALAVVSAVAIYALAQRSDARRSERSGRARELSALALSQLPIDPLRSIRLALRGEKLKPTPAAEEVLRKALIDSRVRRILPAGRRPVNAAAYSPDGSRVVTAGDDGIARIFRSRDGVLLAALRHGGGVTDAAFSADGRKVVTASRDRTARIWTSDGQPLRTLRHAAAVLSLALSADSEVLATISADGAVNIWRLSAGGAPQVFREPQPPRKVVLSRDGRFAAVVGGDRYARVYNLRTDRLLFALPHDGRVLSAAFGPHKELLATGSTDKSGRVWNLRTGQVAYQLKGHQGQVVDVAVSPGGQLVGTASLDGTADIWNIGTEPRGRLVATLLGHGNFVNDITFSPDGLSVVTSSRDGTARVWKSDHGNLQSVLAGHRGSVHAASFSPTDGNVLTFADDGTARIWDPGIKPELGIVRHESAAATSLDVPRRRRLVVSTGADGSVSIFTPSGRKVAAFRDRGVRKARFSPSGRLVVTSGGARFNSEGRLVVTAGGPSVRIWTAKGELRRTVPHTKGVLAAAFSPSGKRLAAVGPGGTIRIWNTRNGMLERRFQAERGSLVALSFSPDGSRLATADDDGTGLLWNLASGRVEHTLRGHGGAVTSIAYSHDGRLVATASVDHDARIWYSRSGALRRPVLRAHFAAVSDARFSDDGRWLVTAGPGNGGLWDVRSGRLLFFLRGFFVGRAHSLRAAAFLPGSHRIFAAAEDGTVRTYTCQVCGDTRALDKLAATRLARVAAHS